MCVLVANLTVVVGFLFRLIERDVTDEADFSGNTQAIHRMFARCGLTATTIELSTAISRTRRSEQAIRVHMNRADDDTPSSESVWNRPDDPTKVHDLQDIEENSFLELEPEDKAEVPGHQESRNAPHSLRQSVDITSGEWYQGGEAL